MYFPSLGLLVSGYWWDVDEVIATGLVALIGSLFLCGIFLVRVYWEARREILAVVEHLEKLYHVGSKRKGDG